MLSHKTLQSMFLIKNTSKFHTFLDPPVYSVHQQTLALVCASCPWSPSHLIVLFLGAHRVQVGYIAEFFRWFRFAKANLKQSINNSHVHKLLFNDWKRLQITCSLESLHEGASADYRHAGLDLGTMLADSSGRCV